MAEESGFTDTLTKEVGGVPVWVIGTGIGAVIAIGAYFLQGRGGSTQTVYSDDDMQPEESDPTNSDYGLPEGPIGDWLRENPGWAGYPTGSTPRGLPPAITNLQWARQVSDWMLATGYEPGIVTSALDKYLNKQSLTAAEKAVIEIALRIIGTPPEGPIPITTGLGPKTPQPATGARGYGWYKVKSGDGIPSISKALDVSVMNLWIWNGIQLNRLTPGEYIKYRSKSNPPTHPYTGK